MPVSSSTPSSSRPKFPSSKDSDLTGITTSSSTSSTSSRLPFSPYTPGSPPSHNGYFEEPQPMDNGSTSPMSPSSKWLPRLRSRSKSPRPKGITTNDVAPVTRSPPQSPPQSPNLSKPARGSRHSGTFSDVGRHGNDWLFNGFNIRDLISPPK